MKCAPDWYALTSGSMASPPVSTNGQKVLPDSRADTLPRVLLAIRPRPLQDCLDPSNAFRGLFRMQRRVTIETRFRSAQSVRIAGHDY